MDPNFERVRRAWRAYHEHGDVPSDLLGAQIARSWQRCRAAGVGGDGLGARVLHRHELALRIEGARELIEVARPYMIALSKVAAATDHVVMLADPEAVVLDVISQRGTDLPELALPGAQISEEAIGPNGIGTALVDEAYVEVVGAEHLDENYHEFTSQGVVLRGPEDTTRGALALTRSKLEPSRRVREILLCAAYGIETELGRRRLEKELDAQRGTGGDRPSLRSSERPPAISGAHASRPPRSREGVGTEQTRWLGHEARRWRELAGEGFGPPQAVDVQARMVELAAMLSAEAARRHVKLIVAPAEPYCLSLDPLALSRLLFRGFLAALDGIHGALPEAELVVGMERTSDGGIVRYHGPNVEQCVRLVDAVARLGA